jgi:two-component system response regulator LytT
MKVLIIEDEFIASEHLKAMLAELRPGIEVLAVPDSIASAVEWLQNNSSPDLVFVDIELGDGQSFDIFTKTTVDAPVIFTTAYQEHALKAFKLNSVDYLLKPVDRQELDTALLKYEKLHGEQKRKLQENLMSLLQYTENGRQRYLAKTGTRLISVETDDISYFYTKDRLQFIKTWKGEDLVLDKRLDEIETEVDTRKFFRVNRQFVVNYKSIQKVHTWFSGKLKVSVQPEAYEEIIVSRLKAAEFKKWLGE